MMVKMMMLIMIVKMIHDYNDIDVVAVVVLSFKCWISQLLVAHRFFHQLSHQLYHFLAPRTQSHIKSATIPKNDTWNWNFTQYDFLDSLHVPKEDLQNPRCFPSKLSDFCWCFYQWISESQEKKKAMKMQNASRQKWWEPFCLKLLWWLLLGETQEVDSTLPGFDPWSKKNSVKRWGIQGMILPICLYNYTANLRCSLRTFDLLCLVGC